MNVKLLKNLAFLGLLSFSVFPSFALSKIIPDGTIPYNMGVQLKGDTDGPEDLDRVQELGMKWVRRGFIWESIEREKGVYDFSQYDRFVNDCEKRGLKILTGFFCFVGDTFKDSVSFRYDGGRLSMNKK